MTSGPKGILTLKPTVSGLEKHWARVQNATQFDKISNNGPSQYSQKLLLPFNIRNQEYGSNCGKVINQAKMLFPRGLELK